MTPVGLASLASSVGYGQPWRYILVESEDRRECIRLSFESCNQAALSSYEGRKAELYANLKLADLREAAC